MLNVQKYLRDCGGTIESLKTDLGIEHRHHPSDPLVILDYSQINSPRTHPIVMECRGLVLEKDTWNVVARPMTRFFNAGEHPTLTEQFDWSDFTMTTKEDGSLAMYYHYDGFWRVNTRCSWADQQVCVGVDKTWTELFYDGLRNEEGLRVLAEGTTYIFELCSPYNKVVRRYPTTQLFLLTAINNETGQEINSETLDFIAQRLGINRPRTFKFSELKHIQEHLSSHEDPTFEGFVCKDKNGMRLKVKSPQYVALHHLRGEGQCRFHPKYILPFVLRNETDEVLTYFPELTEHYNNVSSTVEKAETELYKIWNDARNIECQKEFANYIIPKTKLHSVLFEARKTKRHPKDILKKSEKVILKTLF